MPRPSRVLKTMRALLALERHLLLLAVQIGSVGFLFTFDFDQFVHLGFANDAKLQREHIPRDLPLSA